MSGLQEFGELKAASIDARGGLRVTILNLGAAIASIKVPTADGHIDAVLSYPKFEDYLDDAFFMGSTVGPFANRIVNGRFSLDGHAHHLQRNEASTGHCLHGGEDGLHRQYFELELDAVRSRITCRTTLPDGQAGFPGHREVAVIYQLLNDLALAIDFRVTTNKETVVSLANHAYFNLGGDIEDYEIKVHSDAYTVADRTNAPTGEVGSVDGTELDLRTMNHIGNKVLDHNLILRPSGDGVRRSATLRSPKSNLQLSIRTTQRALQIYTGDHLALPFQPRQGLCLEAQGFPDAPNHSAFPSARLSIGKTYRQRTIYEFSSISS